MAERCHALDGQLADEIFTIAYERYWNRPGLSLRDKSLVTIISLLTMGMAEQTLIHMRGFLNASHHQVGILQDAINRLYERRYIKSKQELQHCLDDLDVAVDGNAFSHKAASEDSPSDRDNDLIDIAASVAAGDMEQQRHIMKHYLDTYGETDTIKCVLLHQIVYCGFPAAMNGFASLSTV